MSEYSDWSGKIHLKIFEKSSTHLSGHQEASIKVDPAYVLVGGGARTYNLTTASAFLTESRPNLELDTWFARSKDHMNSGPHHLKVYAIGMRIDGVTPDYLRSKMRVFSKYSNASGHPSTSVSVPNNYLLIGGGARVNYNGNGNMLVHSYPKANTWYAKSKDHQIADKATIKAYAIGIENISFPNIGHIETHYYSNGEYTSSGSSEESTSIQSSCGCALTCPGGLATFNGEGRMITSIYPVANDQVKASSTDHNHASSGVIFSYAAVVRKRQ